MFLITLFLFLPLSFGARTGEQPRFSVRPHPYFHNTECNPPCLNGGQCAAIQAAGSSSSASGGIPRDFACACTAPFSGASCELRNDARTTTTTTTSQEKNDHHNTTETVSTPLLRGTAEGAEIAREKEKEVAMLKVIWALSARLKAESKISIPPTKGTEETALGREKQNEIAMVNVIRGLSARLAAESKGNFGLPGDARTFLPASMSQPLVHPHALERQEFLRTTAGTDSRIMHQKQHDEALREDGEETMVVFAMAMSHENPLIADEENARFFLWSAMCQDIAPCPLKLFLDDVKIPSFGPLDILFEIKPTNPGANQADIKTQLQTQLDSPQSSLHTYFATIDRASSTVDVVPVPKPAPAKPPPKPEPKAEPAKADKKGLAHGGEDCYMNCSQSSGPCPWCGSGKCCRKGFKDGENGCGITEGGETTHQCVASTEKEEPIVVPPLTVDRELIAMSTTMICIMMLTFQFFLIYTAIFAAQMLQNLRWGRPRRKSEVVGTGGPDGQAGQTDVKTDLLSGRSSELDVTENADKPTFKFLPVLERCKSTVEFAPMLSILFLATRMRALQLTQGMGAPPMFTQDCMYGVSIAVGIQMIIILAQSSVDMRGRLALVSVFIEIMEKAVMIIMYVGTTLVVLSALSMTPALCLPAQPDLAHALWGKEGPPSVSPALGATINLTTQFFLIYLGYKIMETIRTFSKKGEDGLPEKEWIISSLATFDLAKATVSFAPMLSILFVGARMRALEIDPKHGSPQEYAQVCFYLCTYGIMAQAILVLLGPTFGVTAEKGACEGDIVYKSSNKRMEILLVIIRYLCVLFVYGGFSAVIVSVFTIVGKDGKTPAMAPATASVIYFSIIYFGMYLVYFLVQTTAQLARRPCTTALQTIRTTLTSVEFCPMLAVLCLATRMRSREVNPMGSPPGWAQDAMIMAVLAITLQASTSILSSVFGAVKFALFTILSGLLNAARTIGLIFLYVAIVIICASVVIMSPKMANGRGSLLPDNDESNNYFHTPPPFSTTVMCVVILIFQFFAINAAVFVGRKVCGALDIDPDASPIMQILERCKSTVFFAPMLSILFVGTRMRALQLTQGQGAPQLWAQDMMKVTAGAVLGQLVLILAQGAFDLKPTGGASRYVAMVVEFLEKAVMIAMYLSMAGVVYAVLIMSPETCMKDAAAAKALWKDGPPPVSPAVAATINLTVQFFAIYLLVKLMETIASFAAKDEDNLPKAKWITTWSMTLGMAKATVNFAPMLCVLFIGTRMRALEIDPKNGAPQAWAQVCFFVCAYSVAVQAGIVIIGPLCGIKAVKGDVEGDMKFSSSNKIVTLILSVIRWLSLLATYGGSSLIIYSILVITDKNGNVPKISPALQNVIIMTIQYFAVYLGVMITYTVQQVANIALPNVMAMMMSFILTVDLCPMLSVLYLATRMRALEITDGHGGPPGWVQDAMFVATFATFAQLVLCILGGRFAIFVALQTFVWFVTLGASLAICLGIYTMVPQTSTGKGSVIAPYTR